VQVPAGLPHPSRLITHIYPGVWKRAQLEPARGQKGPERLDRPGYPPIPLEPAEVTHEAAADSWTYHAKDTATGAPVRAAPVARSVYRSQERYPDAYSATFWEVPVPRLRRSRAARFHEWLRPDRC